MDADEVLVEEEEDILSALKQIQHDHSRLTDKHEALEAYYSELERQQETDSETMAALQTRARKATAHNRHLGRVCQAAYQRIAALEDALEAASLPLPRHSAGLDSSVLASLSVEASEESDYDSAVSALQQQFEALSVQLEDATHTARVQQQEYETQRGHVERLEQVNAALREQLQLAQRSEEQAPGTHEPHAAAISDQLASADAASRVHDMMQAQLQELDAARMAAEEESDQLRERVEDLREQLRQHEQAQAEESFAAPLNLAAELSSVGSLNRMTPEEETRMLHDKIELSQKLADKQDELETLSFDYRTLRAHLAGMEYALLTLQQYCTKREAQLKSAIVKPPGKARAAKIIEFLESNPLIASFEAAKRKAQNKE